MDVGVARDDEGAERRFACMAGIGFDAMVVRAVTPRMKRYLRGLAFPITAFKVLFTEKLYPVEVAHDDTRHTARFVIVANGHRYGGDYRVSGPGLLTSGELEAVLIRRASLLLRPDIFSRIMAMRPLNRSMESFRAREIHARSTGGEVPVQIDGEVWGVLPMSFRVEPGALEVIR